MQERTASLSSTGRSRLSDSTAATARAIVSGLAGASPTGRLGDGVDRRRLGAGLGESVTLGQHLDLPQVHGVERPAIGLGDARIREGATGVPEEKVDRPVKLRASAVEVPLVRRRQPGLEPGLGLRDDGGHAGRERGPVSGE